MSCFPKNMLSQIAAISGLSVERLGQMVDTARRQPLPPLPPLPLDPAVVDAVLAGLPAGHDPRQGAAVLQAVAQGLRLALRQSRKHPPAARELALLTALTGTVWTDVPPPDPQLVQAMRADLCLRPAPLPLTLPDDPNAQRRAVLAAARVGPWTDDEADRIASDPTLAGPTLAGLAWALGVRHPRICAVVEQSIIAAVAALSAGSTDPSLLRRVAADPSPHWAVQVLVASNRTDPALMTKAAKWSATAAEVLVARPDIADPALINKAAEWSSTAMKVLVARHDITDPALIAAAAQDAYNATQVLAKRHDITDPDLIRAAAREPNTAATALIHRPNITDPDLIRAAAREPWPAATALIHRPNIADPALIRAAAREPKTAADVLAKRHDITDPDLIRAAAREPWPAAEVLAARSDITDFALIAAVTQYPHTATKVLVARPDLRSRRDVLDRVGQHRVVAHTVLDVLGPYPALWNALPVEVRNKMADRYQMTPSERAWIESIATRTPPVWTKADDQMAARFPWHAALRDSLRTEAMD